MSQEREGAASREDVTSCCSSRNSASRSSFLRWRWLCDAQMSASDLRGLRIAEMPGRISAEQRVGFTPAEIVPKLFELMRGLVFAARREHVHHFAVDAHALAVRQARDERPTTSSNAIGLGTSWRMNLSRVCDGVEHDQAVGGSRFADVQAGFFELAGKQLAMLRRRHNQQRLAAVKARHQETRPPFRRATSRNRKAEGGVPSCRERSQSASRAASEYGLNTDANKLSRR